MLPRLCVVPRVDTIESIHGTIIKSSPLIPVCSGMLVQIQADKRRRMRLNSSVVYFDFAKNRSNFFSKKSWVARSFRPDPKKIRGGDPTRIVIGSPWWMSQPIGDLKKLRGAGMLGVDNIDHQADHNVVGS